MRFFLDRNVPIRLAEMVRIFDRQHDIEHHDQHFDEQTSDATWLAKIAKWDPRPVVISGDLRILRHPAEAQVLHETDLTFFALERGWPKLRWEEQAWKFIKIWPLIRDKANPRRPSIFRVPVSASKIEYWCLTSEVGTAR